MKQPNNKSIQSISSEKIPALEFLKKHDYPYVTFDIESIDNFDKGMRNEPLVSFSLTLFSEEKISSDVLTNFPTFTYGIAKKNQERKLLEKMKKILKEIDNETIFIGHNLSFTLECKRKEGFSTHSGFDFPKMMKRGAEHNINFDLIRYFETKDTMDLAYHFLDHKSHGKTFRGSPKSILGCSDLEDIFSVNRPKNCPNLGKEVRDYFQAGFYKDIILYNAVDTIIESIIFRIFLHKTAYCGEIDNDFPSEKCSHVSAIDLDELSGYQKLVESVRGLDGQLKANL
ncbi:hypothetical protein AKJ52_00465 [candidate division MSBL1 archaeon SCGC-AAA382C18]|uniref:Uncharacterized protein n=1 Tax=candidate division MSBL1 archaeon SCGC-AAA382C18 TaxID=1698281 RepID=A0A133VLH7_9EURY|nr:hypothetical protein AKJ52_00465 [candidate division MSBL1 archaeon SCGC-AAA382C18]